MGGARVGAKLGSFVNQGRQPWWVPELEILSTRVGTIIGSFVNQGGCQNRKLCQPGWVPE